MKKFLVVLLVLALSISLAGAREKIMVPREYLPSKVEIDTDTKAVPALQVLPTAYPLKRKLGRLLPQAISKPPYATKIEATIGTPGMVSAMGFKVNGEIFQLIAHGDSQGDVEAAEIIFEAGNSLHHSGTIVQGLTGQLAATINWSTKFGLTGMSYKAPGKVYAIFQIKDANGDNVLLIDPQNPGGLGVEQAEVVVGHTTPKFASATTKDPISTAGDYTAWAGFKVEAPDKWAMITRWESAPGVWRSLKIEEIGLLHQKVSPIVN